MNPLRLERSIKNLIKVANEEVDENLHEHDKKEFNLIKDVM